MGIKFDVYMNSSINNQSVLLLLLPGIKFNDSIKIAKIRQGIKYLIHECKSVPVTCID